MGSKHVIPDELRRVATEHESPIGYVYQAPEGVQMLVPPKNGVFYKASPPSAQTDRLQEFERRHIIPIAMIVAPTFDVLPITDDIYRGIPEYHRKRNLYCVISRSKIDKTDKGLAWDCVVVVVKEFCVVRVHAVLDPNSDLFKIEKIYLWSKKTQRYEVVEDQQAGRVNPEILPYVLEQYARIEGLA